MTVFAKIAAAGIVAGSVAFTATGATALPFDVSGVFTIEIKNFDPIGPGRTARDKQSRATASAFGDAETNAVGGTFATKTIEWTGSLNFDTSRTTDGVRTTVADFFASNAGSFGTGSITSGGLGALADLTMSAGQGQNDDNANGRSITTTLMKITAQTSAMNIGDVSQVHSIRHDDGVTISDGTNEVSFPGPNSVRTTSVLGEGDPDVLSGTDFTLFYAAANGDPTILQVQAVPLPAAAWMLLAASGGLVAMKRRRAAKAA